MERILDQRQQRPPISNPDDKIIISPVQSDKELRLAKSSARALVTDKTASVYTVSSTGAASTSSSTHLFPASDPPAARRTSFKLWNPSNTSFSAGNSSGDIAAVQSQYTPTGSSRPASAVLELSTKDNPSPASLDPSSIEQFPIDPTVNIASQTGKRRRGQGVEGGSGGSHDLHADIVPNAQLVTPASVLKKADSYSDTSLPIQRPSPMEPLAQQDSNPSSTLPMQGALVGEREQERDLEMGTKRFEPPATRAPFPPAQGDRRPGTTETKYPSKAEGMTNGGAPDELAWGPSHPCFPHPNPHVPLSSPLYSSTRIIRIRRDWLYTGDLAPTFSNIYPQILDPLLSENEFRGIIKKVNESLVEAFDPFELRNWVDNILGILTGWIWEDAGLTAVKARLKRIEAWLERWNEQVGARDGVKVVPLRRTAYMTLDIQIPMPVLAEDGDSVGAGVDADPAAAAAATAATVKPAGAEGNGQKGN
jgi:hypothetical protein